MSSGLMVFYPKTHQIPWGYLNSFLSVPRKEARAEAGILLTTRSSSLKKKNLVCSTRTALCHKIGIDLDLNRTLKVSNNRAAHFINYWDFYLPTWPY